MENQQLEVKNDQEKQQAPMLEWVTPEILVSRVADVTRFGPTYNVTDGGTGIGTYAS